MTEPDPHPPTDAPARAGDTAPERPGPRGPRPGDGALVFFKDNLEAIAVAVVMALVIKHFCVEAFKIPTSSMFPTLHGESLDANGDTAEGDRILVDKFAYLLSSPARWHVIVFRYPLNRARNFIKRIAGLPGEHVRISEDGDLWVRPAGDAHDEDDLRIPQKPRDVRETFYRPVYPPPPPAPRNGDEADEPFEDVPASLRRYWRTAAGPPSAWRVESHRNLVFTGGAAGMLRNVPNILEHTVPERWAGSSNAGELVRDVRFRMTVRLEAAPEGSAQPTRLTLRWRPDSEFLAVLTLHSEPGRSEAFVRRGDATQGQASVDARLVHGRAYEVEMEYVDGHLRAHVDGRELARVADGRRFADTRSDAGDQRFRLEAEGGGLRVEDLRIDRDLRYENSWDANPDARRRGIDVPAQSYFMLGDNTHNSSDSRRWRMVHVHLRGGRVIRHDYSDSPEDLYDDFDGPSLRRVTDADGLVRTWAEEDVDEELGSETLAAPFVHEDLIVGRAFLVFWPWTPSFPGRLGFIK